MNHRTERTPTGEPAPTLDSQRPIPNLQWVYLLLAIAGAILPWMANISFMNEHGLSFDVGLFISLANANDPARSLSRDLAISATAFIIWMIFEARRLRMRNLAWALSGCFLIAFAFGAPFFLFLRERRLRELSASQ